MIKNTLITILFLFCAVCLADLCFHCNSASGSGRIPSMKTNVNNSQQVFDFANSLFDESDYRNAISEYNRYLFFYPDGSLAVESQYRIAACYLNMKEFSKAIEVYRKVLKADLPDRLRERVRSKIAECYLFKKDYDRAIDEFDQFLADFPRSVFATRAQFMLGATYTEIENWAMAKRAWREIYSGTNLRSDSKILRDETRDLTRLLRRVDKLPRRSPILSGMMSVILPGLGQTYCGRFSDGFYTLMVVGTLFAGTAYYTGEERFTIAVPLGIVSSIFYAGNIYGGVRAAKVFNYERKSDWVKLLKRTIGEIGESGELRF